MSKSHSNIGIFTNHQTSQYGHRETVLKSVGMTLLVVILLISLFSLPPRTIATDDISGSVTKSEYLYFQFVGEILKAAQLF